MKPHDGKQYVKQKKRTLAFARKKMQHQQPQSPPPTKIQRVALTQPSPQLRTTNDVTMVSSLTEQQESPHVIVDGIRIRKKDGFFSATDMCNKFGKVWNVYWRRSDAKKTLWRQWPRTRA